MWGVAVAAPYIFVVNRENGSNIIKNGSFVCKEIRIIFSLSNDFNMVLAPCELL